MSLVYGRDALGKTVPLLVGANGAPIMAAVDAGGAYHVLRVDANGNLVVAGEDHLAAPLPVRVDHSGRVIISGTQAAGETYPVLVDASGRVSIGVEDGLNVIRHLLSDGQGAPIVAGKDSTATPYQLRVDGSGRPIIAGEDSLGNPYPLRVTALGRPENCEHTYFGAGWRRQNFIWGYYGAGLDSVTAVTVAAGTITLPTTAVPANTVWQVHSVSARNTTTAPTNVLFRIFDGAINASFYNDAAPVLARWSCWSGEIILAAGWYLNILFTGCAIGDNLAAALSYSKMTLNL